jgi:proteasome lid subunit RPN8/RPN11
MRVPQTVLEAIEAHARRESPRECCGLLIGSPTRIDEAIAITNSAADPVRRYEISPADYFGQIKRCRALAEQRGEPVAVIGAYHSHPRSAPEPSPTDVHDAFEHFLFLIAGPVEESVPFSIRAYRLVDGSLQHFQLVLETPANR